MKKSLLLSLSLGGLFLFAVATSANAEEKKVTLTGQGQCAKCELKKADSCQNTVTVEKSGKKTVYFLEKNEVSNKFHKNICSGVKEIKVVGTVKEVDGKHLVTATEVSLVEK